MQCALSCTIAATLLGVSRLPSLRLSWPMPSWTRARGCCLVVFTQQTWYEGVTWPWWGPCLCFLNTCITDVPGFWLLSGKHHESVHLLFKATVLNPSGPAGWMRGTELICRPNEWHGVGMWGWSDAHQADPARRMQPPLPRCQISGPVGDLRAISDLQAGG